MSTMKVLRPYHPQFEEDRRNRCRKLGSGVQSRINCGRTHQQAEVHLERSNKIGFHGNIAGGAQRPGASALESSAARAEGVVVLEARWYRLELLSQKTAFCPDAPIMRLFTNMLPPSKPPAYTAEPCAIPVWLPAMVLLTSSGPGEPDRTRM